MEGKGRVLKGFITKRRKGAVSWTRFREVGLRNLLMGIESYCKKEGMGRRFFKGKVLQAGESPKCSRKILGVFSHRWRRKKT